MGALRAWALASLVLLLAGAVTPIEKVISLITKLQAEAQEEGQKEAMEYDKFACFCKSQAEQKLANIAKYTESIEILESRISKYEAEITELNEDIAETIEETKKVKKEVEEEDARRAKEHAEFLVVQLDHADAVNGMDEAIKMIEDAGGSTALLQMKQLPPKTQALLELARGGPAPAEFHSFEILETIRGLRKKVKAEKTDIEKEEADNKHSSDMAQGARKQQIAGLEDTEAKETQQASEKTDAKGADEEALAQTKADKLADETFLETLTKTCEDTAKAWNSRSQTRSNELMALSEAREILMGKVAANYGANKKLNLVEVHKAAKGHWEWVPDQVSFLQTAETPKKSAATYLIEQSQKLHSSVLMTMALKVQDGAGADHFVKVRRMIKDMVAKLEADAEAEASQKDWCDEEMSKAMTKRDDNIGELEGDQADITKAKAEIDAVTAQIAATQAEIAELYKSINEAKALREAEKTENTATVRDSKAGLKAVKAAIQVLKDFYEKSAALIQYVPPKADASGKTVGDMAPKVVTAEYGGKQDGAKGIIGMMEVIESDFEGTITATEEQETAAEDEYKTFVDTTKDTIKEKQGSVKDDKKTKADTEDAEFDATNSFKDHKDLKNEAIAELAKLKPACVSTGADYAEQVARREQEIESLKSAYDLLKTMSPSFLQRK